MKKIDLTGWILLLFCVLACSVALAQAQLKMEDKLPIAPQLKIGRLPNGLTYYIQQNGKPPEKVELRLVVRAGSVLEDDDQQGLAHFTEHMAFNGSTHFKKNALISFLQSIGVQFGADLNAYTNFDETVYILPIPTDKPDNLDKGMEVLEDWAGGLTLDGAAIDAERGIVLEESRLRKGAGERMLKQTLAKTFEGSRYALRLPIGKDELIRSFPHDAVRRFYADWYRPDLMAVIAVGALDPASVEKMIVERFGKLKNPLHERPRVYATVPPRDKEDALVITDPEASNNTLHIAYSRTPSVDESTLGGYRQGILQGIFNALLMSRLQDLTQGAKPPFISANSGMTRLVPGVQEFSAYAVLGSDGVRPAISALLQENRRIVAYGFTSAEVERIKLGRLRKIESFYLEREKTDSRSYAAEFIRHFTVGEAIPGIENERNYVKRLMPTIGVEEVNQFARKTLAGLDKKLIIYQGIDVADNAAPTAAALLTDVAAASHSKVDAYQEKKFADHLMDKRPSGGTIAAERIDAMLGLTELTLGNGIKVILKSTDFKNDQVLMLAQRAGGNSLFPDQDYAAVAGSVMAARAMGLATFSPTDLQKILAGRAVMLAPYVNDHHEGLSGSAGSADVETLLQVGHLAFTAPRQDPVLFQSYISKFRDTVKNRMVSPEAVFGEHMTQALYSHHPRTPRMLMPADYDGLTLAHAMEIYKSRFDSAKDYTFIFVGSFDIATIKPLIAAYLGSLPTTDLVTNFKDLDPRPVTGVVKTEEHIGSEQKSGITITFTGETTYTPQAQLALAALIDVLKIKLTESLRQTLGATYSPTVSGGIYKQSYGHYSVQMTISCAPANVDNLIAAALAEVQKLRDRDVRDADLSYFKENWRKNHRDRIRTNEYWLSQLGAYLSWGENPLEMLTYVEQIDRLTPADLKQAANTYFNMNNYFQAVLFPAAK